ncbi:hypothetical protein TCAL_15193 [Tigriopus californicus]|uniref:Schlafen AlbA-2 domain-containing protein n=1 Tax=Tigriopus californicus TaxID=6832 RepID=A0A553NEE3_TIGCA|nr:uncharacterized protein LOC131888047 [Tigriopus californicus]TRY63810.1 hypothetical protein TCAL_15193 [Tigriopus californicus]
MAQPAVARAPWVQMAWQASLQTDSQPVQSQPKALSTDTTTSSSPSPSPSPPTPSPPRPLEAPTPARRASTPNTDPQVTDRSAPSSLTPLSGGPREIYLLLDHLTSTYLNPAKREAAAQALAQAALPKDDWTIHRWLISRREPGPYPDLWRSGHSAWTAWDGHLHSTRTLTAILALIVRCLARLHRSPRTWRLSLGSLPTTVELLSGLLRLADPAESACGRYPGTMVRPVSQLLLDKSLHEHLVGSIYPTGCPTTGRSSFEQDVLDGAGSLPFDSLYGQKFDQLVGGVDIMDYESQATLSSTLLAEYPESTQPATLSASTRSVTKQSCDVLVLDFYESGYALVVKMTLAEFSKKLLIMDEKLAQTAVHSNEASVKPTVGQDVIVKAQDAQFENRFRLNNQYFRGVIINVIKNQYRVFLYDLGVVARINVNMPTMEPLPSSLSPLKLSPLCKYLRILGIAPRIRLPVQDHAAQVLKYAASHFNSEIFNRIENFPQMLENLTYSQRKESMDAAWALHHAYFKGIHLNLHNLTDKDFRDNEKDQKLCALIGKELSQGHVSMDCLSTLFYCLDLMQSQRFQETWTIAKLSKSLSDLPPKLTKADEQRLVQKLIEMYKEGNLHQKRERVKMAIKDAQEKKSRDQRHLKSNYRSSDQVNVQKHSKKRYSDSLDDSNKVTRPLRSLSYNALKDCDNQISSPLEKEVNSLPKNRVTTLEEEMRRESEMDYFHGSLFKAFNRNVVFLGGRRAQDVDFHAISQHIVAFLNVHIRGVIFLGIEKGCKPNVGNITGLQMNRRERDEFRIFMDNLQLQGHIKPKLHPDSIQVTFNAVRHESRNYKSDTSRFVIKIEVKENKSKTSFYSYRNCFYVIVNRQIKEACVDELRELFLTSINLSEKSSGK